MRKVSIAEISLDDESRIRVAPQIPPSEPYAFVYRATLSVRWDESHRSLYSIAPDLDALASFKNIVEAVAGEYGDELILSDRTIWNGIPGTLRAAIESGNFPNPTL